MIGGWSRKLVDVKKTLSTGGIRRHRKGADAASQKSATAEDEMLGRSETVGNFPATAFNDSHGTFAPGIAAQNYGLPRSLASHGCARGTSIRPKTEQALAFHHCPQAEASTKPDNCTAWTRIELVFIAIGQAYAVNRWRLSMKLFFNN